jgi:hypothetical protein
MWPPLQQPVYIPTKQDAFGSASAQERQSAAVRLFVTTLIRPKETHPNYKTMLDAWLDNFPGLQLKQLRKTMMQRTHSETGMLALSTHWMQADAWRVEQGEELEEKSQVPGPEPAALDTSAPDAGLLAGTLAELQAFSCQHTGASFVYWPSESEWVSLRARVARCALLHFNCDPVHFDALVETMAKINLVLAIPEEHAVRVQQLRSTPELEIEKAQLVQEIQHRRRNGEEIDSDDERMEASEEEQGSLWRQSSEEMCNSYLRIATRVCYVVEQHARIVQQFGGGPAMPTFPKAAYKCVRNWVIKRCASQLATATSSKFISVCFELLLPLGFETTNWRTAESQLETINYKFTLKSELGIELANHFNQRVMVLSTQPPRIASGNSFDRGIFWIALFLVLLQTTFKAKTGNVDLLQTYIHIRPQESSVLDRLHQSYISTKIALDKRPQILFLQRRWCVFDKQRVSFCTSVVHAFLSWAYLIQTEYKSLDDHGQSWASIFDSMGLNFQSTHAPT